VNLEERVSALERKLSTLERDLREHWHDITTIQLKDKKMDKTIQVLLPSGTKPEVIK
jgi:chromosome segregation ATPase